MKYTNRHRSLGRIVFVNGSTQFLMFNQSIVTDEPVKYTSKYVVAEEVVKPKQKRTTKIDQEDQNNLGE